VGSERQGPGRIVGNPYLIWLRQSSPFERSRWRGGRFACYAPHVMPQGRAFNCDFRFSSDFPKSCKINRLQTKRIQFHSR